MLQQKKNYRAAVVVIRGEICSIITSLRRTTRWANSHQQESKTDIIVRKLQALKESLDSSSKSAGVKILADANYFLLPFLDVIRSEEISGPITTIALSSIEKFIAYDIINEVNGCEGAVEAITDAVIHAHFVSTDPASDELVLMKILNVLHRLFLSSLGPLLSNESVCELMQACFRMCFIERANELLRKSAESSLTDMIQLLFSRLHTFPVIEATKKSKNNTSGSKSSTSPHIAFESPLSSNTKDSTAPPKSGLDVDTSDGNQTLSENFEGTASTETPRNTVNNECTNDSIAHESDETKISKLYEASGVLPISQAEHGEGFVTVATTPSNNAQQPPNICVEEPTPPQGIASSKAEFKNSSGVKFTIESPPPIIDNETLKAVEEEWTKPTIVSSSSSSNKRSNQVASSAKITVPYGVPCVRELLRFLLSIINPHEKGNSDVMIHLGLKLLLVALETGIQAVQIHSSILSQLKNELCKNLIALLAYFPSPTSTGPIANSSILLHTLRILLIIFENLRSSLKYQLEAFLLKIGELIVDSGTTGIPGGSSSSSSSSNSSSQSSGKWSAEQREIVLDFLIQLWKLPNFITELYLNYDCDLFCSNLYEETTKLLSKSSYPLQNSVSSSHLLCLEGLLSILDSIEGHCTHRLTSTNQPTTPNSSSDDSGSSVFYHDDGLSPPFVAHGNEIGKDANVSETDEKVASRVTSRRSSDQGCCGGGSTSAPDEISQALPSHEQLMAIRHKKKIFHSGSDQFNVNASKGIQFLQAHGLLTEPLDGGEVSSFLRENPLLDKRAIGDYISNRKNTGILHSFVKSFDFVGLRVDEALRIFLETFRLPGEAGPIALILEEFSTHWSNSNGNPFANVDAAYILAYQVIMLNVDQHNTNVKRQGNSMTLDALKANLKGCNGGKDFDPEMLKEIYQAIKSEEIVMPAEQVGILKDNYLWKVLLRRGKGTQARFLSPVGNDEGNYDHDLFSIGWGPVIASLSFIFDKTSDPALISKALVGYRKTATISSHYGMSDVFDNLTISLCKFTGLATASSLASSLPDIAGNHKGSASLRLLFQLVHRYGDILREGWKNFVDVLIALFHMQVLPKILTESEDFTEPSGRVSLIRRSQVSVPRQETGLFSSLYSYIALSTDSPGSKSSIAEEEENKKKAQVLIMECRPELLLSESKFLQLDSLLDLIKALIGASPVPESKRKDTDEDELAFVLEVILKITIHNRDRALEFWLLVREHLFGIIIASAAVDIPYVLERATVGLLRVALRLMRKEDLCGVVLQSLKILLYLKPGMIIHLSQQLSFGLHEILKTTAANIHTTEEWTIIFAVLEYIGAGKVPPTLLQSAVNTSGKGGGDIGITSTTTSLLSVTNQHLQKGKNAGGTLQHSLSQDPIPQFINGSSSVGYSSGSDRGYTSDSELEIKNSTENHRQSNVSPAQSWILLSQDDQGNALTSSLSPKRSTTTASNAPFGSLKTTLERQLFYPDPKSLVKCCETLSFLIRDAAHITPDNFTLCVSTIRAFVEASTMKARPIQPIQQQTSQSSKKRRNHKKHVESGNGPMTKSKSFPASVSLSANASSNYDADESDNEDASIASQQVCVQLLDLLHTLHTRAAQIFQWWEKEINGKKSKALELSTAQGELGSIWILGWQPLLQAIALLCSDCRKQVRTVALTYLQRALLVHDLQQLTPLEWLSCFNSVLFPLMGKLLEPLNPMDAVGMEETRMRAATLLCKVFLQHLTPLLQLNDEFNELWMDILDYLNKYMNHSEKSELLVEAIPESLKNLLLVMETAGIFHTPDGYTKLWAATWEKIDSFLPSLRAELIRAVPAVPSEPYINRVPSPIPKDSVTSKASTLTAAESGSEMNSEEGITSNIIESCDVILENTEDEKRKNERVSLIGQCSATDFVPVTFAPVLVGSNEPKLIIQPNSDGSNEATTPKTIDVIENKDVAPVSSFQQPTPNKVEYTSITFADEEEMSSL